MTADLAPSKIYTTKQTGICKPIPGLCNTGIDPVCACNGETFKNECEANVNGLSIAVRAPMVRALNPNISIAIDGREIDTHTCRHDTT